MNNNNKNNYCYFLYYNFQTSATAYRLQVVRFYEIKILYTWIVAQNYVVTNQIVYVPTLYKDMVPGVARIILFF